MVSTQPLRNELITFSYSCQNPRKKFRIRAKSVSAIEARKTIWNSNLSSQSRNRLCGAALIAFGFFLQLVARVGGVKLIWIFPFTHYISIMRKYTQIMMINSCR